MPYLPGPLLLQTADNVGVHVSEYHFLTFAGEQLGDVDGTGDTIDSALRDMAFALSGPEDPFPDVDLHAAMDITQVYAAAPLPPDFLSVVDAVSDADAGLGAAIGFAPAEAWTDPPAPFVSPTAAPAIAIPFIPPNIDVQVTGSVPVTGSVSSGQAPIASPYSVTLTNLTTFNSSIFVVGDQFQVRAVGPLGQLVRVDATLDGQDLGMTVQGVIGSDGTWTLNGTMDPTAIGAWTEQWSIGNSIVADFNFVVVNG